MTLQQRIDAEMKTAMRERDQTRLATLRMIKAALVNRRVETGHEVTGPEGLQVLATIAKQRREAIDQFRQAGRADLVDKEAAELAIVEQYLPPPVDADELERLVDSVIAETGAEGAAALGQVMKAVVARLAGRNVDGKTVNALVRQKLAG